MKGWTTAAPGHRKLTITGIAGAAFAAIAPDTASFGAWDSMSSASGSITVESAAPSTRIAGATDVWVKYAPTLSVDCSPPRACYATTQRIRYDVSCVPRYVVMSERISMDLNGTIVKHELGSANTIAYDAAAIRVLDTLCPRPGRD